MKYLFPLILLLFLFSTNRYLSLEADSALIKYAGLDSYSYLNIAKNFPHLPPSSDGIPFHHGQRFIVPYLVGGLSALTGISLEHMFFITVFLFILGIILLFYNLIESFDLPLPLNMIFLSLFVLNPYSFRYYISIPYLITDISFQFGVVMILFGLFKELDLVVLLGIFISAISRQTALLILPLVVFWPYKNRKITLPVISTGLVVGLYFLEGHYAAQFSSPSINGEHISGIFTWLKESFNFKQLAEFLFRAILPFVISVSFFVAMTLRRKIQWEGKEKRRFLLLLGTALLICAQPIMGGPALTGQNVTRLDMLGYIPMLLAFALAIKKADPSPVTSMRVTWVCCLICGVGSFHHIFSIVAMKSSDFAAIFAALQITLGVVLFWYMRRANRVA